MTFLNEKTYSIEDAFSAADCTSDLMKIAISEWYSIFYRCEPSRDYDPCQRIPYTIVNKIVKTMFGEYTVSCDDDFASRVINSLENIRITAVHNALIGGVSYIKPFPLKDRFSFLCIPRSNILVFGKDVEGNPVDIGTAENIISGNSYYTLLERRTIGSDGLLVIKNKLYRSDSKDDLGRRVPLSSLPRYEALKDEYTFSKPVGLGMVPVVCPMPNCVDGSADPVSIYAAAVGLIKNIDQNEAQLCGEFERGKSRLVVSNDMLSKSAWNENGKQIIKKELKDDIFTGLEDDPERVGITIFSPNLREQNYIARKTEYLRNVESIIGLKRGLLSDVESAERTATEITSSAGDYNLTIIDFQKMWEKSIKSTLVLCGDLGLLYNITGAHELTGESITIDWGNGILYDEDKTWEDYKDQVMRGLIKPEIALGWRYNMPTDTPEDLQKIRERYMPDIDNLTSGFET